MLKCMYKVVRCSLGNFFLNENVPKYPRTRNWKRNYIQTAYYTVTKNDSKNMFLLAWKDIYNQFSEKSKLEKSMFMTPFLFIK